MISSMQNQKSLENPWEMQSFIGPFRRFPTLDRADFLVSLSGLYEGYDCAGPIDYSLYGLRNTTDVYSMSGCGIYLEGHYVRCSGADALVVWEKHTGKFYFAIVHGGQNGKRLPPSDIHAFPGSKLGRTSSAPNLRIGKVTPDGSRK